MNIHLIRHAEPREVLGRCYGRLDLAVSDTSNLEALEGLRQRVPQTVLERATVYTSPLSRCVALARALAAAPIVDDNLLEIDFGTWEGVSWDAVPRAELDDWARDLWNYRPGGGENAAAVFARWELFVARVRRERHERVIAVTHAGVIRVALARLRGHDLSGPTDVSIGFGSVHSLSIDDLAPA